MHLLACRGQSSWVQKETGCKSLDQMLQLKKVNVHLQARAPVTSALPISERETGHVAPVDHC